MIGSKVVRWGAPVSPNAAPGEADRLRSSARFGLRAAGVEPSEDLVELTALHMAEKKLLSSGGTPLVRPTAEFHQRGMLRSGSYLAAAAAAGMGGPPTVGTAMLAVLSELNPDKLRGSLHTHGSNEWRITGQNIDNMVKASVAAGTQVTLPGLGRPLSGVLDGSDAQRVEAALQPLVRTLGMARLQGTVTHLHLGVMLGEMGNLPANSPGGVLMAGLAANGQVAIARHNLDKPQQLADVLAHEVGHLLDTQLGNARGLASLSSSPGSPFGRPGQPHEFATPYAVHNEMEDFAETHALYVRTAPALAHHPGVARQLLGALGRKLDFVAREVYRASSAPADAKLKQVADDVREGRSPFGFCNEHGAVCGAEAQLVAVTRRLLDSTDSHGHLDPSFLEEGGHDQAARRWLHARLQGEPAEDLQPVAARVLANHLVRVDRLVAAERTPDNAAARLQESNALRAALRRSPPELRSHVHAWIDGQYDAETAVRLKGRLDRFLTLEP